MAFVGGYTVFVDDNWDIPTFLFSYAMIGIVPVLFVAWKLIHRTTVRLSCVNHSLPVLIPGLVASV